MYDFSKIGPWIEVQSMAPIRASVIKHPTENKLIKVTLFQSESGAPLSTKLGHHSLNFDFSGRNVFRTVAQETYLLPIYCQQHKQRNNNHLATSDMAALRIHEWYSRVNQSQLTTF